MPGEAMRILLVEDEKRIADFIRKGLSEQGYAVDLAYDGDEALQWVSVAEFDALILDVMLPVRDGIEVCHTLRKSGFRTPILMLTARDAVEDRVRGLDSGADDYLVKPFAFAELLARLRALTRREPGVLGTVLQVGDLALDTTTREVSRQGARMMLTNKEYAILEYLMRHPNQVLTRTMIAEHVWNYDFDNATNVIDVHIRNLRRKIDDPSPTKLIHTVRGAGYRISDRQRE
jgi:heavy metal response regulator